MTAAETPPNGTRVTLAILNANLLHLTQEVQAMRLDLCQKLADHEQRLREAEGWTHTSRERWRQHEEDHKTLNVKNTAWDIIGSLAAAITGIVVGKP